MLYKTLLFAGSVLPYFLHFAVADEGSRISGEHPEFTEQILAEFSQWEKIFGTEHHGLGFSVERIRAFEENKKLVEASATEAPFTIHLNKFATLTQTDFAKLYLMKTSEVKNSCDAGAIRCETPREVAGDTPASLDWRNKGAVSAVKDQKQCGSCWAFSATGALEGSYKIITDSLPSFSEQELVDCAHMNLGCHGGDPALAFLYVTESGITNEDYVYKGVDGHCKASDYKRAIVPNALTTIYVVIPNNSDLLKRAVSQQPISVVIFANQPSFMMYNKGVYNEKCDGELDHAVLLVGYGRDVDVKMDYWIVKNSWGITWGEAGYIRFYREDGQKGRGQCGICLGAIYPELKINDKAGKSAGIGSTVLFMLCPCAFSFALFATCYYLMKRKGKQIDVPEEMQVSLSEVHQES